MGFDNTDGGITSQAESANERDRLIAAARQVMERNGWWGFKVENVLKQSGLSTRSFYRHFEKKSDLLVAVLDEELADLAVRLQDATAAPTTHSDRVRAYVVETIDFAYSPDFAKRSSLLASLWRELIDEYPEAIEHCAEKLIAPLSAIMAAGLSAGELECEDPVSDSRAIFYMLWSITADQAALGSGATRAQVEDMALGFVTRAIGIHAP